MNPSTLTEISAHNEDIVDRDQSSTYQSAARFSHFSASSFEIKVRLPTLQIFNLPALISKYAVDLFMP